MKKLIILLLSSALILQVFPEVTQAKSHKPSTAVTSIRIIKGQTRTIHTKNVTKGTKVSFKQSYSGKKAVKVRWIKKSKKIQFKGLRTKKAIIKVQFKKGKKKFCSRVTVRVMAPTKSSATTPVTSSSMAPSTPTNAAATSSPASTASAPAQISTAPPTTTATQTPYPTYTGEYSGDEELPIKNIYSKYFMMGAALNGSSLNTMALNHKGMTGILLKHFNSTVLSNLMKPSVLLDEEASKSSPDGMPVCKFDSCDSALQFCKDNGLKMRGHTLIWHNQTPDWLFYEDYDISKKPVDAATMDQRMESYIKQVITHCQENFPGVIYCWDVVNECICTDSNSYITTSGGWKLRATTLTDNDFTHETPISNYWYATMGETYVEKAFTYARKYADSDVKLFYNDYNVFQTEKMENIYRMVDEMKSKGIIDGIGLQPTVGLTYPTLNSDSTGSFKRCLEKYAELDLEIQITELSFEIKSTNPNDIQLEIQADRYEEFMELLLEEDSDNGGPCNITSVTVFGICDDYPLYSNYQQNLYLWNKDCQPKDCFYSFIKPGLALLN